MKCTKTEQAYKASRRFTSLTLAINAVNTQVYNVPVLMGDITDECTYYIVPATNRDAGTLIRAGYSEIA